MSQAEETAWQQLLHRCKLTRSTGLNKRIAEVQNKFKKMSGGRPLQRWTVMVCIVGFWRELRVCRSGGSLHRVPLQWSLIIAPLCVLNTLGTVASFSCSLCGGSCYFMVRTSLVSSSPSALLQYPNRAFNCQRPVRIYHHTFPTFH